MLNRVRLPFYLSKPQYPAEEDVYLKGNGRRIVLKAIVNKVMDGKTDYMPSLLHERLSIALRHDEVNIESDKYTASIKLVGAYDIDWQDFLDYPFAPANFKAFEEAFVARSNRCDICTPSNFLTLVDDTMPDTLEEGMSYDINVATNDSICCSDPVFSIFSYDTDYIDSISITQAGVVSFTLKAPLSSAPDKLLFTYKVACDDTEETANVTGTVEGTTTPLCEAPSGLILTSVDPASLPEQIHAEWTEPGGGPPGSGYSWYLTEDGSDVVIASGTTTDTEVDINALDCGKTYRFWVRAVCDEATDYWSGYINDTVTTPDCVVSKDMFGVNQSGVQIEFDIDGGPNYVFPPGTTSGTVGDIVIVPGSILTNLSGFTVKFRFLSAMPSTLITEQIIADGFTYVFPVDVSNYNYVTFNLP